MKHILLASTMLALMPTGAMAQESSYLENYVNPSLLQCAGLYKVRNDFYNKRGLCFTRPGALQLYPNNPRTCIYASSDDLPMSAGEKRVMREIVTRERELGCPRP